MLPRLGPVSKKCDKAVMRTSHANFRRVLVCYTYKSRQFPARFSGVYVRYIADVNNGERLKCAPGLLARRHLCFSRLFGPAS